MVCLVVVSMREVASVTDENGNGFVIVRGRNLGWKKTCGWRAKREAESERCGRLKRVVTACGGHVKNCVVR